MLPDEPPIIHRFDYEGYTISMLRLDLIHPEISGNKWFKLKYNLLEAQRLQKDTIITFGGAFSNHIAATAYACKISGLKSVGIIRGEPSYDSNPTLCQARKNDMKLLFLSRGEYKQKDQPDYLTHLNKQFPTALIVPEGGDNEAGQKGCEEILNNNTVHFTHIFCAYGTGTTFKGIYKSLAPHQYLTGINVLNYKAEVFLPRASLLNEYHFGGYAKHNGELLAFKAWFEKTFNVPLDYVYTSKACYAVFDLIKQSKFNREDKILVIHTGGLQGNKGYEERYNLKPSRQVNDAQG